jgi:hypothetical protein
LNVLGIDDVRQTELHAAEPLVPEPISFEVEIAVEKSERYKFLGNDHILTELIQSGDNMLHSEIHLLILF